ncbi:MAG TPA: hypothetical protein VJT49_16660 [Amycolatopsis sp.]|uniref:hypothetical protein n=1 Tax=Amycolatopsis sp. TaxID=37632 RepID=UPI002B47C28E|nr:hypothetical protein [Amycolatopsis sp.]HKS46706.1 hypothetical protein [Amycolatopsis sp.]
MSLFDALEQRGTLALLRFTGSVVVFLVLHLIRIPFVLVAQVLEHALRHIDAYVAAQASRPPPARINHFYDHREEAVRVQA